MEGFFEYMKLNYFVDYELQEIKDMTEAILDCLEDFKTEFNKNEECGVKIEKIFLCGSMSEQTSIWLGKHNFQIWKDDKDSLSQLITTSLTDFSCLEFDILAILRPLTNDMETVSTCAGHAKIESRMYLNELTMSDLRTKASQSYEPDDFEAAVNVFERPWKVVNYEFHNGMLSTVKKRLDENGCFKKETDTGICTLEFLDSHTEANPLFIWINKNNQKNIVGKIDFLPAFETTHMPESTFIVAKPCTHRISVLECSTSSYCESNCKEQCWRVSQSIEEMACIRNSTRHHRDLYRTVKIFCDKATRHNYLSKRLFDKTVSSSLLVPTSYHIKTVFLHHIKDCNSNDITYCFCEILIKLKQLTDRGSILNWNCTYELLVDWYEIYFFYILWKIFYHVQHKSSLELELKNCPYKLSTVIEEKISVLISCFLEGKICNVDFEKDLESILAFPLLDYAMGIIHLDREMVASDRCDFELEKRAKVYECKGVGVDRDQCNPETKLSRSHSENDLNVLANYFDDKNVDKHWEDIFWRLKTNGFPTESLTRHIKISRNETDVFTYPEEDILPYNSTEKECIVAIIREDVDYWYDRLQETFVLFSNTVDVSSGSGNFHKGAH